MKLLLAVLLFSSLALADMAELDVGVGQNTKPFYGLCYEFVSTLPYISLSGYANQDYVQLGASAGLQFEHFNFGFAIAHSSGQFSFGPEFGYMQNLTSLIYFKENNSFFTAPGGGVNFSATFGIGLNL